MCKRWWPATTACSKWRFVDSVQTQAEYLDALEQHHLGGDSEFGAFVAETALAQRDAFVRFAARFPPPLHWFAHVSFLRPLAHRHLCALVAMHSICGAGRVLPLDLQAAIERQQQQQQLN